MQKLIEVVGALVLVVLAICVLGMIFAWPVMMLWNLCLVPAVEGLREVGWLQAWGILVVCGLLFKSHNSSSN